MLERLEEYAKRYDEITQELSNPDICSDIKKMTSLSKEQRSIERIVEVYKEYKTILESQDSLKEMKNDSDKELAEMAAMEYEDNKRRMAELDEEIKVLLIPKDPNDEKDVIVTIQGAAGGDEANIFAGDLFRMYSRYAETRGWKITILDSAAGAAGGYSQIEFSIRGESVYSYMKYESGAHRVQRIPVTEANGRIQTSTATVLVLPEADELDTSIDEKDLKFDTFCSGGPGGQGVNTTYSGVRVTHIPTGIAVACTVNRSQHENKALAMQILQTRLNDLRQQEKDEAEGKIRQELVGRGDRSEKIRTYNYPQNRVTDHRIGFTINRLDAIIDGKVDLVINELIAEDQRRKLNGDKESV